MNLEEIVSSPYVSCHIAYSPVSSLDKSLDSRRLCLEVGEDLVTDFPVVIVVVVNFLYFSEDSGLMGVYNQK